MRNSTRLACWLACVGFVILAPFLIARAQAPGEVRSRKATPAVLQVLRHKPTIVAREDVSVSDSQYRQLLNTQVALINSEKILRSALRSPKLAELKLDSQRIRENLKVEIVPDTEMIRVRYSSPDPTVSVLITNEVVDAYMEEAVNTAKRGQLARLDALRKLWDQYQQQIKTKQAALRSLRTTAGDIDSPLREVMIAALKQSYLEHSAALDRLAVQKGILARDPAKPAELNETASQIKDRQDLLRDVEARLSKFSSSAVLDITSERGEVALANKVASEIGEHLERAEIELQAPGRIRVISLSTLE